MERGEQAARPKTEADVEKGRRPLPPAALSMLGRRTMCSSRREGCSGGTAPPNHRVGESRRRSAQTRSCSETKWGQHRLCQTAWRVRVSFAGIACRTARRQRLRRSRQHHDDVALSNLCNASARTRVELAPAERTARVWGGDEREMEEEVRNECHTSATRTAFRRIARAQRYASLMNPRRISKFP